MAQVFRNILPKTKSSSNPADPEIKIEIGGTSITRKSLNLGKVISTGNFGEVKEGTYKISSYEIKCVVKILKFSSNKISNEYRKELKRELENEQLVMSKLNHPNIVKMLGVCNDDKGMLLVLELMPGGSLKDYLRNNNSENFPEHQKINMMLSVCEGMKYLSEMKIIHRDLAARNILLDRNCIPKIADFGMARITMDGIYEQLVVKPGPLKWYAPECLEHAEYTSKSDVWSFGVTMWETFTCGGEPYENQPNHVLVTLLQCGYRLQKPMGCGDSIYSIMRMCWKYDRSERPDFSELQKFLALQQKKTCDDLTTLNSALQIQVENLKSNLEQEKMVVLDLHQNIKALQEEKENIIKISENRNQQLINQKKDLLELKKTCDKLTTQNSVLQIQVQQLKSNLEQEKIVAQDLDKKNETLQNEKEKIIKEELVTYYSPTQIECVTGDTGKLGSGTYGCVRLAYNKAWGAVAVKCIQVSGSKKSSNNTHKTIRNECRMLQLSTHINVLRVIGYTTWPRSAGIIMEYMLGGDLKTLLLHQKDKVQFIAPSVGLRFVSDISNGIAYMHNIATYQRVTHGDLKVDNILLTGDLTCKISDFGGANFETCTEESSTNASQYSKTHTKVYLAPEALKNPTIKVSKSMDVYSFAMMVYMILTRNYPFKKTKVDAYLEDVKIGGRPDLEEVEKLKANLSSVKKDIEIVDLLQSEMENCWEQNEVERPTIMAVRDRLNDMLSGIEMWKIQNHVSDIVRKLDIKIQCMEALNCQPIDKFVPPHFE